ncbi:MAG TPA: Spy/CpxP family protein refolding chaperone [Syntrophorhabdales bacterium]|nr:Spy/CpxP family protein refolding chaperone [Syntrophorhabdales bacterium]
MKKLYAVLLAAVLVAIGTAVYAVPSDPGRTGSPEGRPDGRSMHHHSFLGRLDLSQEQKERMHEVWSHYHSDVHDLRYAVMEKRLEVRKLFTDPKVDQAALLSKEKELSGLRQKLEERRTQAMLEWRSILTPEQIQKLDVMPRGASGMYRGRGMM